MLRSLSKSGNTRVATASVATLLLFGVFGCRAPSPPRADAGAAVSADASKRASNESSDASVDAPLATSPHVGPPPASSPELRARTQHLLDAIAQAEPDLGRDVLMPKQAYLALQTKHDAHHTYESEVVVPFRRRVRMLSKRHDLRDASLGVLSLGDNVALATRSSLAADASTDPMWRARKVRLTARGPSGSTTLVIAEMISFENAWYILKL